MQEVSRNSNPLSTVRYAGLRVLHPDAGSGTAPSGQWPGGVPMRRFELVPLWGMKVFFLYAPRCVDCPCCGVKVECLPWTMGKHPLTEAYAWFLARWAKRLSWREVAEAFQTSWEAVFGAVEMAVLWGRAHVDLSDIRSLGIDELA